MFDIDKFKEFNDSSGTKRVMCLLAESMPDAGKHLIRSEDVACRYGGDEFVVILPDSSAELAANRADIMRIAVGREEFAI